MQFNALWKKKDKWVNNEHHDTRVLHTGRIIYMSTANLYSQKTQKIQFLPVIELMSDSLTAIKVEPHQCSLHQSILLIQGPICEIFAKKSQKLAILKNGHFENRPFWIFFHKCSRGRE